MRYLYLLVLLLFCSQLAAQQAEIITISGAMIDSDGYPMPGVTIRIKGTNTGTTTDFDGNYTIAAPVGATLLISFVGFSTYEVQVTRQMGQSAAGPVQQTNLPKTTGSISLDQKERGVADLSESSTGYTVKGYTNRQMNRLPAQIAKIKRKIVDGQEVVEVVPGYIYRRNRAAFNVEITNSLAYREPNRLPSLQTRFAQGRNITGELVYRGPVEGEPYSWGPDIKPTNEKEADKSFDALRVFRPAWSYNNELKIYSKLDEVSLDAGYSFRKNEQIIPGSNEQQHAVNFAAEADWYAVQPRVLVNYQQGREQLPLQGANLAHILGSLYTTPPTFDLLNGYEAGPRAWRQSGTYLQESGAERTYAPGKENHPYWLLNTLPDAASFSSLLTGLKLDAYSLANFRFTEYLSFQRNYNRNQYGYAPGTVGFSKGALGLREVVASQWNSRFDASAATFELVEDVDIKFSAAHLLSFKKNILERWDAAYYTEGSPFSISAGDFQQFQQASPERLQQEVITKADIFFNKNFTRMLKLRLSNQIYFSNTLKNSRTWLPQARLEVNMGALRILQGQSKFLQDMDLAVEYSRNLQEAPLLYNQYAYASLQLPAAAYRFFLPTYELVPRQDLAPEENLSWEANATLDFAHSLSLNTTYFHKQTEQMLLPIKSGGRYSLHNAATLTSQGWDVSLNFSKDLYSADIFLKSGLNFSRIRPEVKEVYGPATALPVAGFQDVSLQYIEGAPANAIVGSRFLRNQDGALVIGNDGFPLVAENQAIVGNANPDWTAGYHLQASWREKLSFYLVLDARMGGDVWNGTRQFLNYFGTSAETAADRDVQEYIFEGVREDGSRNQQPVALYNPAMPLEENYWQRYGVAGVTEAGIEDASSLRINEISLSYNFADLVSERFNTILFTLQLRNLLLASNYSGRDPVQPLFGYAAAQGLDLFNQPNTRSYGCSLTLNF